MRSCSLWRSALRSWAGQSPEQSRRRVEWRVGRRAGWIALILFLSLTPAGCNSLSPGVKTSAVEIFVAPGANNDSALQVDVVAVYDHTLLTRLLAMPATAWFTTKPQITLDYPDGFRVWNWQLVPGTQMVATDVSPDSGKSYDILVFAGYAAPGDHRARLGKLDHVRLSMGPTGFTAQEIP